MQKIYSENYFFRKGVLNIEHPLKFERKDLEKKNFKMEIK